MKIKKIVISVLVILVICAFIGYKIYNKPHVNVANTTADVAINANDFFSEFSTDESKANSKYLDKIVEVQGIVSDVKIENKIGIITLETEDDFGSVLCHLSEKATENINAIKVGNQIKIKGICTGYLMDVIIVKAEITNP